MKKEMIRDERIIFQQRKIFSEAFLIIYFGLQISLLLQLLVFDVQFTQVAAEFILFMLASIYIIVRYVAAGIDLFGFFEEGSTDRHKITVTLSIVFGIIIAAATTILLVKDYGLEEMGGAAGVALSGLVFFVLSSLLFYIVCKFLNNIIYKKIRNNWKMTSTGGRFSCAVL
ncbi:MAG: hypothetical protein GX175_11065 [Halanaerobiaceae bacterium]|jgi:hypothetical protein|nr:hypothetical protein [Halanaerobiaceae bacterium]